jgi:[glutamine synthetase] adenylyltransferase / [glutamine synthetase]-adenylyl-L-tyrosine phosphorylase
MAQPLAQRIKPLPDPADRSSTASALDRLSGDEAAELAALANSADAVGGLLRVVFAASPFLTDLIVRDPAFAVGSLKASPEDSLAGLCNSVASESAAAPDERTVKSTLRRARAKAALVIALADLGGAWDCDEVTSALTRFADASIAAAVDWLLRDAERAGRLHDLDAGCGYVILAMGKYGAFELNYSSDIDLIVLYDPETAPFSRDTEPATFFVRMTRRLVKLLQERTGDGYVFRVDLRLRPDPRATNVAIAIEAAAQYYESLGQNWERAAMIKVRPCGGDLELGREFVGRLTPFIWRKYLDYASIADVHSMKRQIHAFKGHGEIAVAGHNIKLGRGGIREIEFFVQTQQLIAGGRNPELRNPRTVEMLDRLAAAEWITPEAAADLKDAYRFLRRIEHRIQMVADAQSHDSAGRRARIRAPGAVLRLCLGR